MAVAYSDSLPTQKRQASSPWAKPHRSKSGGTTYSLNMLLSCFRKRMSVPQLQQPTTTTPCSCSICSLYAATSPSSSGIFRDLQWFPPFYQNDSQLRQIYRVSHLCSWTGFGRLEFCVFLYYAQVISSFCQIPISPRRIWQRVKHSKSNSINPGAQADGTPCMYYMYRIRGHQGFVGVS